MELRKLKALLGALKDAGVASYRDADLTLEFGPQFPPVPTGEVEGAEQDWTAGAPMDLAKAVAQIQKAYAPKQPKGQAQ